MVVATCVYVWQFTIDSIMFFSHVTPRTLSLKHNACGRPPRPSPVHLTERTRTNCRSDGDDGQWNRMRLAPYTRDHGGQWSYVESPCEGNKQTRNMNDDDTHSTSQGCQLNVEPVKVAKRCIFTMMTTCVYVWRFTIDSCMFFSHLTPRTLPLKHNARGRPATPFPRSSY